MTVDLLLWIVLGGSPQAAARSASPGQPTAAMFDQITCQATLRRAGGARTETVTQQRHGGTYLSLGDQVRCTSQTGSLTLILKAGPKLLTLKDGPYTVRVDPPARTAPRESKPVERPVDPDLERAQKERAALVAETLRHHGERGATRGTTSAGTVIYPSANGLAWPAGFVIRWNPELASPKIGLSVWRVGAPNALWSETDVDGRRGLLDSADAKKALGTAVAANPTAQQIYILQFNDKTATAVPFRVLAPEDARALEGELGLWAQEKNELLRLVGRAYSFDVRRLHWEAAQEYKAAFELTGSCDMLNEAVAAAARAGDDGAVRRLTDRRPKFAGGCADRHR